MAPRNIIALSGHLFCISATKELPMTEWRLAVPRGSVLHYNMFFKSYSHKQIDAKVRDFAAFGP